MRIIHGKKINQRKRFGGNVGRRMNVDGGGKHGGPTNALLKGVSEWMSRRRRERTAKTAEIVRESPISLPRATFPPSSFILLLGGDGEKEKQNRRTGCWLEVNSCGFVMMLNIYPPTSFAPRISSSSPSKFVLASWISSTLLCVCVTRERMDGRADADVLLHFHPPSLSPWPLLSSPLLFSHFPSVLILSPYMDGMA